jgi:hypothetical protein
VRGTARRASAALQNDGTMRATGGEGAEATAALTVQRTPVAARRGHGCSTAGSATCVLCFALLCVYARVYGAVCVYLRYGCSELLVLPCSLNVACVALGCC